MTKVLNTMTPYTIDSANGSWIIKGKPPTFWGQPTRLAEGGYFPWGLWEERGCRAIQVNHEHGDYLVCKFNADEWHGVIGAMGQPGWTWNRIDKNTVHLHKVGE